MNIFDLCLQWHRKFTVATISNLHVKFVSECTSSLLDIDTYNMVNRLIESKQTLIEYSMSIEPHYVAYLHHRVQSLVDAGYLVALETHDEIYFTPDFDALYEQVSDPLTCRIVMLSQCNEQEKIQVALITANIAKEISFVVVDDYLDPRLKLINTHYKKINKPWLLLKFSGERALVGPLFSAQVGDACWHCLSHRMQANDALKWIQYNPQSNALPSLAVPTINNAEMITKYLADAVPLIDKIIATNNIENFFEFSMENSDPRAHPVIYRPQCESCGDEKHFDKQVNQEIKLSNSLKIFHKDGGVRCIKPRQTIEKLSKLISPLSGLLTHISTLSKDADKINKIYRSGFYQTPLTLDFLTYQLSNSTFMHTTMGKGISIEQSKASALSEAIERLASQFQGDEPYHFSSPMNDNYITPQQLSPFSEKQYKNFIEHKENNEYQLYSIEKYDKKIALQWAPIWSITQNKKRYIPLSYCYAHTPYEEQKFSRFYHNGGAAGNTLEEALLQAFLEVVERDAVSIWWYNQLQKPSIEISTVSVTLIEQLQHTLGDEWEYWALDLTHDLNIPVVAAIAQNKVDHTFSFGFGCHIDPIIACQRALTELCQITEIRHTNVAPFEFDKIKKQNYLFPNGLTSHLSNFSTPENMDILDDLNFCFEQASSAGLDVLLLNYSRPDMVLHTAKVVLPGTCHIFPYLAAERLYNVPVKMGWLAKPKQESELNQQALLI